MNILDHVSVSQSISEFAIVSSYPYAGNDCDLFYAEFLDCNPFGFFNEAPAETVMLACAYYFSRNRHEAAVRMDFADNGRIFQRREQ